MKEEYSEDTSEHYDDMVGYIADDNLKSTISEFVGLTDEYKPSVKPKAIDPDFPEDWQNLFINFKTFDDYKNFMLLVDEYPGPKVKEITFSMDKDEKAGILTFFEQE